MPILMKTPCSKCGAQQNYNPGDLSLKCEYCGAETKIDRPQDVVEHVMTSDYLVPLGFDTSELTSIANKYMISGDFTPDDMLDKSTMLEQRLFYVPTYIFRGEYNAKWTASFGYDRTEHYTEYVSKAVHDSNGKQVGYKQVPVTKTKTVTDWRPVNGVDSGSFVAQVYAGESIDSRAIKLVEDANLKGKITEFDDKFLAGFQTKDFTESETDAYRRKGEAITNSIIDAGVKRHAQGDHQRDWHWTADISKDTDKVLMPLAYCKFEYAGAEYAVWVDGSDPSQFLGDDLPIDSKKRMRAHIGFAPLAAATGALGINGALGYDVVNALSLIVLALAGGYGYLRRKSLITYSKTLRSSLLTQKTAASATNSNLTEEEQKNLLVAYQKPKIPFFAKTGKDNLVLPGASLALVAALIFPGIYEASSTNATPVPVGSFVVPSAPAEKEEIKVVEAPPTQTEQSQLQNSTENSPPPTNLALAPRSGATSSETPSSSESSVDNARRGPSFDCSKASHIIENMICDDDELSKLDLNLNSLYQKAKASTVDPDSLRAAQISWIRTMRQCSDKGCLQQGYRARIAALQ
jgi:uncharacterized protein YecT (DUF1311 family)